MNVQYSSWCDEHTRGMPCDKCASPKQPEVDPLFEAAHYQEGRDLLPDGVNGLDGGQP